MSFAATAVVGGIATLGGAALSASAASKASKAQQNAADQSLALRVDKDAESQFYTDVAMYGYDQAISNLKSRYSQDFTRYVGEKAADPAFNDQQRARVAELDALIANGGRVTQTGGNALPWSVGNRNQNNANAAAERLKSAKAERDALVKAAGGSVGTTGLFDVDAIDKTKPGILQRLEQLTAQRQYDSRSLLADAQGIEDGLAAYGKEQEANARRDAERAAQGLARVSRASLMGRGLGGGTAFTDIMAKGSKSIFEGMTDKLTQIGDQRLQLQTAAKGDTLNLKKNLFDSDYYAQSQPINTELQYVTGQIKNPWVGQNTSQYFSAASPSAAAGSTWGNLFSAVGGQATQMGLLGMLSGGGGGGGVGAANGMGQGGTVNGVYYPSNFVGPTPRPY